MREYFEALEHQHLAPYAVKSGESQGRVYPEKPSSNRTQFQRDRDRIVHSKAFRRLKHKTQVFVATESDHYRSRLTHTMEVAQVSRHLARMLKANEDLSECIALAHDLGHTPFGHAGERELNQLMADHGGFEHNLQSFRVIDKLEHKYPQFPGLNLSYEVRQGLLKHSTPWDTPEDTSTLVTLEAQIANVADEIAYNNHDLDDGLSAGILNTHELIKHVTLWREATKAAKEEYANIPEADLKYVINSHLIGWQIMDTFDATRHRLETHNVHTLDDLQEIASPLVAFSDEMKEKSTELREYLYQYFYMESSVYRMNKKGQDIIKQLFDAYQADSRVMPLRYQEQIADGDDRWRVIADYIAGMTDTFAAKELEALTR